MTIDLHNGWILNVAHSSCPACNLRKQSPTHRPTTQVEHQFSTYSTFHFGILLFVFIDFYLFSRACLYMCNWCFPLRCLFQCLFVCLFVLLFYFIFIPFLYLFIVYAMWLYFFIVSLKVYVALKWDYHNLFVYWLIVYVCLLIDCIRCILKKIS